MKILYVVSGQSYFSPQPSRKILALVQCWRRMGHEVELICGGDIGANTLKRGNSEPPTERTTSPWYRKKRYLATIVDSISEIKNLWHDYRLSKIVAKRIRIFKPDLYLQRSSRLDGQTLASAMKEGVPTVLEWKDGIVCSPAAKRVLKRPDFYGPSLLKWLVRRVEVWKEANVDFLIVESAVLKTRLSRELRMEENRIYVAHNAVSIEEFESHTTNERMLARQTLGLHPTDFIAMFVGSFAWYQGVELLIEALSMSDSSLHPMRVVLVGDGPGREGVERRAHELGVEERTEFVGKVPHEMVPQYLAAADAAVLPDSTDIIAPIKILEYMSIGLPVILPNYEANREVIENGVTGYLFRPRDTNALEITLRKIQQNPEEANRIGEAAKERVREIFSWENTWGRAIEEIWERVNVKT